MTTGAELGSVTFLTQPVDIVPAKSEHQIYYHFFLVVFSGIIQSRRCSPLRIQTENESPPPANSTGCLLSRVLSVVTDLTMALSLSSSRRPSATPRRPTTTTPAASASSFRSTTKPVALFEGKPPDYESTRV